MSRHAGLAHAIKELAEQVPEWLEQLPAVLEELLYAVVLPVGAGLLVAACIGILLTRLKRIVFPPNAAELHKEALQALLMTQYSPSVKSTKAEQQAEQLLWKALQKDPSYEPAVLSLAALYVYRQRNGKKATQLLRNMMDIANNTPNKKDADPLITGLLLDAQAVEAGQYQMVQAELREAEFLQLSFADSHALYYNKHNNPNKTVLSKSKKKN